MNDRLQAELSRTDFRATHLRKLIEKIPPTASEQALADKLPDTFLKQVVLLDYIVDFLEPVKEVVVEVEGPYHYKRQFKDWRRDRILFEELGLSVFRVGNDDIVENVDLVADTIKNWIPEPVPPLRRDRVPADLIYQLVNSEVNRFMAMCKHLPRNEVVQHYDQIKWRDTEHENALRKKLNEIIAYWPDEGYHYWYR